MLKDTGLSAAQKARQEMENANAGRSYQDTIVMSSTHRSSSEYLKSEATDETKVRKSSVEILGLTSSASRSSDKTGNTRDNTLV